jgi:hypothetical protein
MKLTLQKTVLAIALLSAGAANAEAVKTVDQPYQPAPEAPATGSVAPAASAKDSPLDGVIADNPITKLQTNRSVASQLESLAIKSGWLLIWDAPDFQLDYVVAVNTDIVKAVQEIVDAANGVEARLRASFYRGNNVIRVTEY